MSAFPPLAKPPALIWIKFILTPQNIPYAAENKCRPVMILWRASLQHPTFCWGFSSQLPALSIWGRATGAVGKGLLWCGRAAPLGY
jgi:hypothetical protein